MCAHANRIFVKGERGDREERRREGGREGETREGGKRKERGGKEIEGVDP